MARPMTAAETRAAMKLWGVQYREYSGWETRTRPGAHTDMRGVVIHHTGSDAQTDAYLKWLFTEGRASEGIPAPLCNVSTDMDGDLWLGALGRANHAGKGSSGTLGHVTNEDYAGTVSELRPGADNTDGNAHFYGNEVRYDGGQPMTAKQYASATRWAAAICHHYGWSALSVIGHREWTSRKDDPGRCPMNKFRADVAALLKAGPPKATKPPTDTTPKPPVQEDDMQLSELVTYNHGLYGDKGTEGVWNKALHAKLDLLITGLAGTKLALAKIDADDAEDDAQHQAVLDQLAKINQTLADAPAPGTLPKA